MSRAHDGSGLHGIYRLLRTTVLAWSGDYAPSMGAAISYYTVFSIAPLLLIVIAVAGLVFDRSTAQAQILAQLAALLGPVGERAIEEMLRGVAESQRSGLAAIIGTGALLIGATSVFGELQSALDRIWGVSPAQKAAGWWNLLRTRLLSFGMILGLGFLLAVSLALSAALSALGLWWGPVFDGWKYTLKTLNAVVSFGVLTFLFAMIFKFLPRARIAWRDVGIGAIVTALLFEIGKELIGVYLGTSGITSTFGAAGSLAVLLVWVYYSAQVFLLGAEFTRAFAHQRGSRRGQALETATKNIG
ncbi:MAG: YihY/virulence factor BrkB family protein [Steroidobacteraceae bacterium]